MDQSDTSEHTWTPKPSGALANLTLKLLAGVSLSFSAGVIGLDRANLKSDEFHAVQWPCASGGPILILIGIIRFASR